MIDPEVVALTTEAFEGELFGEALFASLRDRAKAPGVAEQFELLRRLEVQTAARLRTLAGQLGVDVSTTGTAAEQGRAAGDALDGTLSPDVLERLLESIPAVVDRYRRLAEILPADHRATMDAVIAHEEALAAYARASLDGDHDPTVAARALLHD